MNKRIFFFRLLIVVFTSLLICGIVLYTRYSKYPAKSLALIRVSNSICYNANIQHLAAKTNIDQVECLVLGSSISLNNLSAGAIEQSLGKKTYNLSSWGFPLYRSVEFFKEVQPERCRQVIIAFDNIDFAADYRDRVYDFSLSKKFLTGNRLLQIFVVMKSFNFLKFDSDTKFKDSTIRGSALDFDNNGSVLLDHRRFPRSDEKLKTFRDTTGFAMFTGKLQELKELLHKTDCRLVLVYVPYRSDVLNRDQLRANDFVAATLKKEIGKEFIDLHREAIPDSMFWDGSHLYSDGAALLTSRMLVEMNKK